MNCVFVHGNSATLTGALTRGGGGNTFFPIGVVDNDGLPANPPDAFNIFLTPFELGCAFPIDGLFQSSKATTSL